MMNVSCSPPRRIALIAAVALAALAMAGCSKKINTVDPSYTSLEGQSEASAHQIVWPDLPASVSLFKQRPANCDTCIDTLVSVTQVYPAGPGVINGMIFDGTAASSYQVLRREANGGYLPLYDYLLNPVQRFAQSGWKLFIWQDLRPTGFDPLTYQGRGIVAGTVTPQAPLTNVSIVGRGAVQDIRVVTDSLRSFEWTNVPTASGYILQVYSIKRGYPDALIYNAAPSPFATQDHRDYLVAWLPAVRGQIQQDEVRILSALNFVPADRYLVHVSAVDSLGQLVGVTSGSSTDRPGPGDGYFRRFRLGAFEVVAAIIWPGVASPAQARFRATAAPLRSRGAALGRPGYPTGDR
jgi:hypothetical protein